MLKNYIIISLRYLWKNFLYVGINILGLAVALAICITAYLNNKYDADWDSSNKNIDHIYKVNITKEIQDRQQEYGISPFSLAPLLKQDLTGADEICRYRDSYSPVKYGENIFSKRIGYADPNFFNIFTEQITKGDKDALKEKGNILISERIAEIYFGDDDPLGKVISVFNDNNKEYTFIVKGVFKNLPLNSSFRYDLLTHIDNFIDMWEIKEDKWDSWIAATFLLINNEENIPEINRELEKYIPIQNSAQENWQVTSFFVKSLKDNADDMNIWANWLRTSFHPAAVAAPPIMAILILIIAAFNFMNSAISFAGKRLKEIGLRKVFGGLRKHIIIQFLSENMIISFFAIIIGIFIAGFFVPEYSSMWEYMDLSLSFKEHPSLIIFILILWIATTLLAGAYPAFYVSKFNPVKIFRDKLKLSGRNILSKILLGFQFFVSVMALVSGVLFAQNAIFQDNLDLGYDKDNVIVVGMNNNEYFKPFEQVIKDNPKIEMYAGTNFHIGYGNYNRSIKYLDQKIESNIMNIGYNYLQTMKVNILKGRGFSSDNKGIDVADHNIVVNEKFVKSFGLKKPIGTTVYMNDTLALNIIGVSKNVYLYGVWSRVEPLIYLLAPEDEYFRYAIRVSEGNATEVNEYLRKEWAELVPNYPYEGEFQDQLLKEAKEVNKNIKIMYVFLAICALFLSAIGLYTLVSLSVINRTKEIGIRKVMGAPIIRIMKIIISPYTILILIASVLGCVVGYYSSYLLMESVYEQYVNPNAFSFLIPVLIIIVTSALTIIWRVYKAAAQNPANSLRYE